MTGARSEKMAFEKFAFLFLLSCEIDVVSTRGTLWDVFFCPGLVLGFQKSG
jgi:hypothetical protein